MKILSLVGENFWADMYHAFSFRSMYIEVNKIIYGNVAIKQLHIFINFTTLTESGLIEIETYFFIKRRIFKVVFPSSAPFYPVCQCLL